MIKLIFRIIKKERRARGSGETDVQTTHMQTIAFSALIFRKRKKRVLSAMQTQFT